MSSLQELNHIITTAISSNIKPQFLQIVNVELMKYIDTGDRMKDGSLLIIVNSLITLLLSILYYICCKLYNIINTKIVLNNNNNTYKINVKNVLKNITTTDMNTYMFKYRLINATHNEVNIPILFGYLQKNNILDNVNVIKSTYLYQGYNKISSMEDINIIKNKGNLLLPYYTSENCDIVNYFMPVEVYKNELNEDEYIFLYQGELQSKTSIQLNNFILKVLEYKINYYNTIVNQKNELKIIEAEYDATKSACMITNTIGDINPNITFNKIHFDEKHILLDWIYKFTSKTLYPSDLPLVNKLGILLYGPPGTGKTGCIYALANEIKRNILIIKSLTLKGQGQNALKELIKIHQKTSIIVFDEIDYLLNGSSQSDNNDDELHKYNQLLINATTNEEKTSIINIIEDIKKKSKLAVVDTKFILQLLDGIGNDEDRIIIATTNNPEQINPLYLRPGRFDVILKLSYCSFEMFKNIIITKYKNLTDEFFENNREKINNILSLNITPLILINKLVVSTDIDSLLSELSTLTKKEYETKPYI